MVKSIEIKGLTKRFGQQTVLDAISLIVNSGEIVGLIGPSGAGKSTIIKLALGMEKADQGLAKVFNQVMPNRQLLSKIGYMAQTDALYQQLTGLENLKFFAQMKGLNGTTSQVEIEHAAKVVDLTADLGKRVKNYSGGMSRRLSLAIALLGQPELMILDEPTVGVDPALRRQIWQELKAIRDAGRSILITTHMMEEAELVDQVALILGGQVIAFDQPAALKTKYGVDSIEAVFLTAEGVQL